MSCDIRELQPEDVPACERVLRALPDWFGIEASNREYIGGLVRRPSFVATVADRVVGFVSVERHDSRSAEIHVIAVDPALHRDGVGSALVGWTETWCQAEGVRWLHVKTRGPATPDPGYEKTRRFYLARGFEPLFETLDLWGPQDAALIMIKVIPE